ncbi:hypothetical protein MCP1_70044 [Candidatus Terasakiella magnetica]|nr:hypothetical protein MCP1_70044 [Candidatus Terasakiella magnetica]
MSARPAILIVEDSPALSFTYSEYLRSGDWDVRVVDTGTKAWEVISSAPPRRAAAGSGPAGHERHGHPKAHRRAGHPHHHHRGNGPGLNPGGHRGHALGRL